ncbi:GGDEF domain-containing protein [Sphingobium nicotianae]|uniref:diguanylate cyclase n=1 Tax=Sphingobium nicotianae TaxID=2782607 RepID=A0A9X1ISQ6_9SPHN|nr:GGDEF domain-containing protein [Sphingobium nicotianae]MBT2188836.1 GGDEF domain-containing protein [Sphingobium nicotianae]
MDRKKINRKTATEAIRFLDANMLDATPTNYTFAYLYLTGANGWLRKQVDGITDGGVRLHQKDVDDLMDAAPGETGHGAASTLDAQMDEQQAGLRHQMLSFADLTAKALNNTGAFGRELAESAEQASGTRDLASVISAMIEKTAEMERRLAETCRETERLRQDLDAARDDATRDALTNLPNRRAIDRQLKTFADHGMPMAIAFCDIDHFKSINDRFGHAVGDRVLKVVAETLAETMAPHVVGRFGGEEFVVVLPQVDGATAFTLVEKARTAVGERNLRVRDTDEVIGQVTFSAGIALCGNDPEAALREADSLLYEAKSSGRNRTIYKAAA